MRPGRLTCVLCVALLMGAVLGGCCSEEESSSLRISGDAKVADKATEAPPEGELAEEKGDPEGYDPKVWDKELNEQPLRVNPSAEAPEGNIPAEVLSEGQEPADRLIDLQPAHIGPVLARAGWEVDKAEGEVLKDGRRFEATKGEASVRVEMVQFDTVEEADAYMLEVEKDEDAAFGRAHTKFIVVTPNKKEDLSITRDVLRVLMPTKVEENAVAQKALEEADKGAEGEEGDEAPEGFDPKAPVEQTKADEGEVP